MSTSHPKPGATPGISPVEPNLACNGSARIRHGEWAMSHQTPLQILTEGARLVGTIHAVQSVNAAIMRQLSPRDVPDHLSRAFSELASRWSHDMVPDLECSDAERTMLRGVTEQAFREKLFKRYGIAMGLGSADLDGVDLNAGGSLRESVAEVAVKCGGWAADLAVEAVTGRSLATDAIAEVLLTKSTDWETRFECMLQHLPGCTSLDRGNLINLSMDAYWARLEVCDALLDELTRVFADGGAN